MASILSMKKKKIEGKKETHDNRYLHQKSSANRLRQEKTVDKNLLRNNKRMVGSYSWTEEDRNRDRQVLVAKKKTKTN